MEGEQNNETLNEEQQSNDKKQESGKVKKQFENALASLTLILGGESLYKPNFLIPEDVKTAVQELSKKRKEEFIEKFKEKANALIDKKMTHDKHVLQLKREFEQKQEQGMKDFIKDANDLFKMARDIKDIEKNYLDVLMSAGKGDISEMAQADAVELIQKDENNPQNQ